MKRSGNSQDLVVKLGLGVPSPVPAGAQQSRTIQSFFFTVSLAGSSPDSMVFAIWCHL